ncbi:MAG: mechanosensitive ion channel family protein [Nanoarchaeota archaeon]|nr:mechanosensitive ion channel family protein [Nanoarchaeota archaeon]
MVFKELLSMDKKELLLSVADKTLEIVLIALFGIIAIRLVDKLLLNIFRKTKLDETVEQFLQSITQWSLWIVLGLIVLKHVGVDTTPLLASLSIIGFITGFALKDVLSNMAAGMMILSAKPFKVRDFIKSGDVSGTVIKIGISSCVIRTADNLKITVPNSTLWGNPITDYSTYDTRRVEIKLGIAYNHDIEDVLKILSSTIKMNKNVLKDPAASFSISELGEYTVDIIVWFWVKRTDYLDTRNAMNKAIKEVFEKEGIEMPNPTMDIYMKK